MAGCSGAISVPKLVSIPARAQAQAEQSGCEQGQGRGQMLHGVALQGLIGGIGVANTLR